MSKELLVKSMKENPALWSNEIIKSLEGQVKYLISVILEREKEILELKKEYIGKVLTVNGIGMHGQNASIQKEFLSDFIDEEDLQ